ncbi:unnamed protein product [Ectocarpus sp. CCAP 1310/34]|nr:unnamed protein product [Ectocarpus sp. CCAP 1310/34]
MPSPTKNIWSYIKQRLIFFVLSLFPLAPPQRYAGMKLMRNIIFGEGNEGETSSPVRIITRHFTATGEEKEDSDDAGTHREMHTARKSKLKPLGC